MKKIDFKNFQKYLQQVSVYSPTNEVIEKIRSMDSHTAYALLGGYLASIMKSPPKFEKNSELPSVKVYFQSISNSPLFLRSEAGDKTIFFLLNQLLSIIGITIKDLKAGKLAPGSKFIFMGEGPYLKRLANLIIQEINNRYSKGNTIPELEEKLKKIADIFLDNERLREDFMDERTINRSIKDLEDLREIIKSLQPFEEKLKLKELEDRLEKIGKVKDDKINELKNKIDDLKENIKDQEILEKEISDLKKEKDSLEKDKDSQITNLKERLENLDAKIKTLEELRQKEVKDLKEDLQVVKNELQKREKEIRDKKIDEMAKEIPDLEKLINDLEKGGLDIRDLEQLKDKLKDIHNLTKDQKNGLKEGLKDLQDLQKDIQALRDELAKQKLKEIERKEKEKEIAHRENKLDELYQKILKLRNLLADLENLKGKELKEFRDKLDELDELKGKVGDSKDKIASLEDKIDALLRELISKKKKEITKQKELEDKKDEIKPKEKIKEIKEIDLEELKKNRGAMDAYVFMIVVFLTQLHTKQAEKLKAHGETLKKIAKIFDHWNLIEKEISSLSQNAKTILQWIKEGKIDSNYNLYTDNTLSKKETDSRKLAIWNTFKSFNSTLAKRVHELKNILNEVKKTLPLSSKYLIDTMYKLSDRLLNIPEATGENNLNTYLKVLNPSVKEKTILKEINELKKEYRDLDVQDAKISEERIALKNEIGYRWNFTDDFLKFVHPHYYRLKQRWNNLGDEQNEIRKKKEGVYERISTKKSELRQALRERIALPSQRLTIIEWITDSDQTRFKSYMDNVAQGITALTSISNMAQQELQIDTQYYNSLLGLQKGGMDSLTRTIQGIIANMR